MRKAILWPLAAAALACSACFDFLAGGSGTGTGNSVAPALVSALVRTDGSPAAGVTVKVRPSRYLRNDSKGSARADSAFDGVTDGKGAFRIDSLPPGSYVLDAQDSADGVLWRFEIPVGHSDPVFSVRSDTVRPLGRIQGVVKMTGEVSGPIYIGVYGSEILALVNSDGGFFVIPRLPAGTYALSARFSGDSLAPDLANIAVRTGEAVRTDTIVIQSPYPEWKHTASLILNTTASGADVAADVTRFPLLVRLDATFPFAQAAANGADIRFSKPDGAALPYEIERWDPTLGKAEIWVAMDTVYGNRSDQSLRIHWGNPSVASRSDGAGVFPASGGYRGVWHFSESSAGVGRAAAFRDATGQGNDGLDSVASDGKAGIIGAGQAFSGAGDYIHVPKHVADLSSRNFTVTAWVLPRSKPGSLLGQYGPDGLWSEGETGFYFGDGTWITGLNTGGQCSDGKVAPGRCVNGLFPSFVGFKRNYIVSAVPLDTAAWHMVSLVWAPDIASQSKGMYYLDGKPVAAAISALGNGADSTAFDFFIGKPGGLESADFFKGTLDELRVQQIQEDPMRIRLRYESERVDSRLLTLELP